MPLTLTAIQRRVLGVLIEKSLTTPGSYPMSLNALVTGCNQLTCRDPVMNVTEAEVSKAVYELQRLLIVKQADPDRTARVNRFKHNVEERWGWDNRQRAIMAELLLRGPQTVGELKANASRMTPITELQYVADLLANFAAQDPPLVRELPRQPGRSVPRFDHTFYPDDEPHAGTAAPTAVTSAPASAGPATAPATPATPPGPDISALEARVARLEAERAELREQVRSLKPEP
ncbi:MAG: DUF480 domain-containing protein [Phycisphaerae bacterium]|nr:DUF480 domain-containing protein [Phycisphaerae bacterium]